MELKPMQRFLVFLGFSVKIGTETRPEWTAPMMMYAFKCKTHGVVKNYLHGYSSYLPCPECMKEYLAEESKKATP
jgi:hypothetical protein